MCKDKKAELNTVITKSSVRKLRQPVTPHGIRLTLNSLGAPVTPRARKWTGKFSLTSTQSLTINHMWLLSFPIQLRTYLIIYSTSKASATSFLSFIPTVHFASLRTWMLSYSATTTKRHFASHPVPQRLQLRISSAQEQNESPTYTSSSVAEPIRRWHGLCSWSTNACTNRAFW